MREGGGSALGTGARALRVKMRALEGHEWAQLAGTDAVLVELTSNSLERLPPELMSLAPTLRALAVSWNLLTSVPASIGRMQHLESLDLSFNHLQHLPCQLCSLRNLRILNLSDNELQALPAACGDLTSLERLQLQYNQLSALPSSMARLSRLHSLSLAGNPWEPRLAACIDSGCCLQDILASLTTPTDDSVHFASAARAGKGESEAARGDVAAHQSRQPVRAALRAPSSSSSSSCSSSSPPAAGASARIRAGQTGGEDIAHEGRHASDDAHGQQGFLAHGTCTGGWSCDSGAGDRARERVSDERVSDERVSDGEAQASGLPSTTDPHPSTRVHTPPGSAVRTRDPSARAEPLTPKVASPAHVTTRSRAPHDQGVRQSALLHPDVTSAVNLAARLVRRSGPSTSAGSGERRDGGGSGRAPTTNSSSRASTTNSSSRAVSGVRERDVSGRTRRHRPPSRERQSGGGGDEWGRSFGVRGGGEERAWLPGGGGADGEGRFGSGGAGGEQGYVSVEARGAGSQSRLAVDVRSNGAEVRAAGEDGRGRRREEVGTGGVGVLNIPAGGGGVLSIPRGRVLGAHWVSSGDTEEEDLATVQQFVQRRLRGDRRYAVFMQSLDSLAETASEGRVQDSTGDEQPLSGTSASPPPPSFQHDTEGVSEGIDEWVDVSEGSDGGVGDLFEEEEGHLHEAQERLSTALRQAQERSVLLSSSLADVGEAGRGRGQGRVMHGAAGRGDAATEAAAARKEAASAAAGAEVLQGVPKEFLCPVSRDLMRDPVLCPDGHSYDRRYMTEWLCHKSSSPMTNEPWPEPVELLPNHALRSLITCFVEQNGGWDRFA